MATEITSSDRLAEPIVRRKTLTADNNASMMTVIDFDEYGHIVTDEPIAHGGTGEGPSPLQTVLGALCGCESVTFRRTASEMEFEYDSISFVAAFTIDIRGRLGLRTVRPHFQTVRVEATVVTSEPESRFEEVVEEAEARCPVYNLLVDANVNMEVRWIRDVPAG